ncbi:MAG: hypothetical protein OJI67_22120 [Prosthecobacter sp.]|nr:hypothetical protein [Prosthecobacter sp.]
MLKREGETLIFQDVLPPPLPESENYAALSQLRSINIIEGGDEKSGQSGANRQALLDLAKGLESMSYQTFHGVRLGQPLDWNRMASDLKKAKFMAEIPAPGQEAQAIRMTMDAKKPLLKILTDSATRFQAAEFVPALRDQVLPEHLLELKVPHHMTIPAACRTLALHGLASSEMGDASAAYRDVWTLLLFSDALQREPLMTSHLMSQIISDQGFEIIWNVLRHRGLAEVDLASLQAQLLRLNFEQSYLQALRGDMISMITALDALDKDTTGLSLFKTIRMPTDSISYRPSIGRVIPHSYFTLSKATLVNLEMEHLIRPLKSEGLRGVLWQRDAMIQSLNKPGMQGFPFDHFLAALSIPTVAMLSNRAIHLEAMRLQAVLACALERYYMQKGNYPDKLNALLPEFLTAIPLDPLDHQPIRYRQTQDGRYILWCIGFDDVDDLGQVNPRSGGSPASMMSKFFYKGDWAWQYTPVKTDEPDSGNRKWVAPSAGGLPPLPSSSRQ